MQRFYLSIRKGSHIGQQLPSDSEDRIIHFLRSIILLRKRKNINPENIINMDETAFNYNMNSNVTINKIGAKTIMIKTQNQEKLRISAIMSICGNGERLKPYLNFKGAHSGRIYHSLSKLNEVNKGLVVINVNNNAWSTKNIIKKTCYKKYIYHILMEQIYLKLY